MPSFPPELVRFAKIFYTEANTHVFGVGDSRLYENSNAQAFKLYQQRSCSKLSRSSWEQIY
jgi:hypothetical protein